MSNEKICETGGASKHQMRRTTSSFVTTIIQVVIVAVLDEHSETGSHETRLLPLAVDIRSIWFIEHINTYVVVSVRHFQ